MKKINSLLIVDDDHISNLLTSMLFSELYAHTQIRVSENGAQALEEIKDCLQSEQNCPDVIFLDVEMPTMDGFEFLERLEELNKKDLPIVLLTSSLHARNQEKARKYKIKALVEKPLTEEKIESVLLALSA
ncbi:response regulator [Rhodocytophaga aerolata]|uniref:Response regulator n=1 Tax=Rhodocytophaga aerolata TaxID=455078 RepID=A0ABT8RG59_9BACT|nr:response regulator [Rhodocytophaga aerolata]MDO1451101.1 response regulator [Rhodocytophaga aerolata]